MTVKQLFDEGNLPEAINLLIQEVKSNPSDTQRRTFLFELLAFSGDLERASKQLDVVGHQDTAAEPAAQTYRNILHAEQQRRLLYTNGVEPEFLTEIPGYARLHLEALNRLREERLAEAKALLDESEASRPVLRGEVDGKPCDEFRDCDDLLAPFLELIILRSYVWVPLDKLRELEISRPERPRDLLWAPARLVLSDRSQRRGYIPVLYHGSHEHSDTQVRLGRKTDWKESDSGPVMGQGQRIFLAGSEGLAILTIRNLTLEGSH